MSIASNLNRIKSAKSAIKEAIIAKGGTLTDEHLDMYADAIVNLPSGGGGAEFYKCASVDTGEGAEYIEVSGAGSSDCNGKYYLTNLKSNYASIVYKHESREWYCYYNDGYWGINSSYDMEYYNGFYCTYVDDVTGPWNDCMGAMPSPAVSKKRLPGTGVKSWTGYKAVLTDGVYSFEETLTTGLSYGSALTPVVGNIYSADTSIKAVLWLEPLYTVDGNTIAYISFDDGSTTDLNGHLTSNEKGSESDGFNNTGWYFNGGYVQISPNGNDFVFGTNDFTMETYIYPINTERQCIFGYENYSGTSAPFAVAFSYSGDCRISVFHAGGWNPNIMSEPLEINKWHHIAFVRKNGILSLWIDGEKQNTTIDLTSVNVGESGQKFCLGRWSDDPGDFNKRWQGNMDEVRISNIARYQ